MPPKSKFTREEIIEKAFELLRQDGIEAVSARNIAKALSTSQTPIYSYFESMKQLEIELIKKVDVLMLEYMNRKRSGDPFYDMGVGFIGFAREESNIFMAYFMGDPAKEFVKQSNHIAGMGIYLELMRKSTDFAGLKDISLEKVYMKMWMYCYGVAVMCAMKTDFFPTDDASINAMIHETGGDIIAAELRRSKSSDGQS